MHQEKKMLAHISEDGTRVQTVADHLQGTAVLCGQFAAAFDAQQQELGLDYCMILVNIVQSFKSACKVERSGSLNGWCTGGCPIWSNPTGFCYCGTP